MALRDVEPTYDVYQKFYDDSNGVVDETRESLEKD